MSGSVNKATILGTLGRDPEVRSLNSGDRICNLSIATSESWRDKQTGEKKEATEWHRVTIMNDSLADIADKYLRKGSQVYIEGQIKTRKWTDQAGVEKYSTEIVVGKFNGTMTLLGGGKEQSSGGGSVNKPSGAKQSYEMDEGDIPFVTSAGVW